MSSVNMPKPSAVPASPTVDEEAQRKRQIMENEALAEAKANGRASTIVGGGVIARARQHNRAVMRQSRAASELL